MKFFRLFLPVAIILILSASCRKEERYRIGVAQCSEDDWRMLMNEEIEREIMFHPEANVEIRSASDSNEKQISDIRYFIDNGFDIIIAAPNEADALTPVITEAYEKGIPVLIFDRNVNGNSYTAFQGADNAGIGAEAARYASRLLPGGARAIELQGRPGSTPAIERGRGFHAVADSLQGGLSIVASAPANWNYEEAVRVADSLFSLYPEVNLVYAHNDRMALGAAEAARLRGIHPRIIGIDAAPGIGMKAVDEGVIDATFLYPTEGQQLVRTALAILEGEPYDSLLLIPASPAVDKTNVDLLLRQNEALNDETIQMKKLKEEIDDYWNEHTSQMALLYTSIAVLVLLCIVLFLVLRAFWQHRSHRAQLLEKNRLLEEQRDLEKELNSQLAAATQSKLVFFTNVSHDLRTPLTLIAEPVEQVANATNLTEQQHTLMKIADKNVRILKRLINQILDFRKFESDKLPVNLEEVAPGLFAREWTEAFIGLAAKQDVKFNVGIELPADFTMALDVDKTERVVFNLLFNAFKFTSTGGTIDFRMALTDDGKHLRIVVADTGKGISAEALRHIFSRFYQVDKVRPQGSGIGLSLAKAFVELQGGTIEVESEPDKGTSFTVTLPVSHVGNEASGSALDDAGEAARAMVKLLEDIDTIASEGKAQDERQREELSDDSGDKPRILIVDDNEDVRLMVRELLKDKYQVIAAADGREGIEKAARYVPDAIVCDVMMPGIDGMETCAAIKRDISTSHIPVLMLTACSLDEQKVEGYECGADGYMSKPFNSEVLRARLASLIANRRRIREVFGGVAPQAVPGPAREESAPKEEVRKDIENEFYGRFLAILDEELGNMDLSVDALAEKMGMGRSQFYRKIKALTGLSPVELLRDMRLKKARELLLSTDKTVSEIAYEVGFSNPAYFTKCYREVYSETPTALRERTKGAG